MTKAQQIQLLTTSIRQIRNARQLIRSGSYNVKDAIKAIEASDYLFNLSKHCQAQISEIQASGPDQADLSAMLNEALPLPETETKD